MSELTERLSDLRARVDRAAVAAGREPAEVRILLATKTQPAPAILDALRAGYRLIGENRVQEITAKADELAAEPHETHLIGPLQGNKVNTVLGRISCLQSLDSLALAERLQRRLDLAGASLEVFLQVNVSGEASKHGVDPAGTADLARAVRRLDRLRLTGLMTVGLNSPDETAVRSGYTTLARLAADLGVAQLSMGMSGDFEWAVAEGATTVRLGSAVFGPRAPAE